MQKKELRIMKKIICFAIALLLATNLSVHAAMPFVPWNEVETLAGTGNHGGSEVRTLTGTGDPGYVIGQAIYAEFHFSSDIYIRGNTLYIADKGNNKIRRMSLE